MNVLVKNAEVFCPEPIGKQDILILGSKIVDINKEINFHSPHIPIQVVNAVGEKVVPGYVDQHVHLIGGGGEAGPFSRVPEIQLSELIACGVTTAIGVLGTDGTSRHLESLLVKVRALETEGISAYMLTGSYEYPLNTLTGDARRDLILIDKVLGIGEFAISDHRSSQPTYDELRRICSQAHVGGMLAGKKGVVQLHVGIGKNGLAMPMEIVKNTEIPAQLLVPTHVNRSQQLFEEAIEFARLGGYLDLTSGIREKDGFAECITPSQAIRRCLEKNVPMNRVTMSSDGNGSMSISSPDGKTSLLVARLSSLHEEMRNSVLIENVPLEYSIRTITENPARANGIFPRKGTIKKQSDGDLVILDSDLNIRTVIAKGKIMMNDGQVLTKGTFE